MKKSTRPIEQVRDVLNAALELNDHHKFSPQRWQWIVEWAAGSSDHPLPSGLELAAKGKPFRLDIAENSAILMPLEK